VARDVSGYLESASYAMIAALGLYLIWTTFRPHGFRPQGHAHALAPHHDHHAHGHDHHGHQHDHAHCGHAHAADPQDLRGEWSLSKAFSLAFAVGIRPCTGAILVLVFANSVGLYWAGIASTLVMGFGVFLTVALIAALTVYARQTALRMASGNSRLFGHLVTGARLAGGLAIALIGTTLFFASLGTTPGMV
jgi:ABC-type nickel/cobalt efflux system permease component RcnA